MKNSVRQELTEHINDTPKEERNHYTLFNEDYYIIGYFQSSEWLTKSENLKGFKFVMITNQNTSERFKQPLTTPKNW